MAANVGDKFTVGRQEWEVISLTPVDSQLTKVIELMTSTGKDVIQYGAVKVLKSGKRSVQGGMFLRFSKSGNFIPMC